MAVSRVDCSIFEGLFSFSLTCSGFSSLISFTLGSVFVKAEKSALFSLKTGAFSGCFSLLCASKPVAITVTCVSPLVSLLIFAPKITLQSLSATSRTKSTASYTSDKVKSRPPVMFIKMPVAPSMLVSSSWLVTAWRTASIVLLAPRPRPIPICATPLSRIIVDTSAKSRLISPLTEITSLTP